MKIKQKRFAVIGGGPIGLFTAIKLGKLGHQVDLFERSSFPRDKVCGQGIMPSGVELLKSIGIQFSEGVDCFPFKGVEYLNSDGKKVRGPFSNLRYGIGMERKILSNKLFDKCQEFENIHIFPQTYLGPSSHSHLNSSYEYIFVCDGLHSKWRRGLKLEKKRKGVLRLGARAHYDIPPWSESVQVYWSNGIEAYITPVSSQRVEVAFLWFEGRVSKTANLITHLLEQFPELQKHLISATPRNDFKAYGPFRSISQDYQRENFILLGDAYKFLDGITGEGLSIGMKAATIILNSLKKGSTIGHPLVRIRIFLLYLNYSLWVKFALFLGRKKALRSFIFTLIHFFPSLMTFILNANDGFSKKLKKV